MNTKLDLRPSPIAGQWYSGNAKQLATNIDQYISGADLPDIEGEIIGIIAPHAGYIYSGPVAGYAFAAVQGQNPDLVAVVSPMHQPYFEPLLTSAHDAYHTPLGAISINRAVMTQLDQDLQADLGIGIKGIRRDQEHSLEIELPFLQRSVAGNFSLLPIMIRDQSVRVARALGTILARTLSHHAPLLVASTDLSHFYPQETARKFDQEMLRRIADFDPVAVLNAEDDNKGFACGRGAVAAVLWAAKDLGANHIQILNYATSGEVSGDYSQVVGYGAAVITRTQNEHSYEGLS
jgi:MEMO1 family protein